jgi:uncharacterized protein
MDLILLPDKYSICRFSRDDILPDWIYSSDFYSVTRTGDELSVVTKHHEDIRSQVIASNNWRILRIQGPLDLSLTGIISGISSALSEKGIPVFTISTYDTDYILVRQDDLFNAIEALRQKGHNFVLFPGQAVD